MNFGEAGGVIRRHLINKVLSISGFSYNMYIISFCIWRFLWNWNSVYCFSYVGSHWKKRNKSKWNTWKISKWKSYVLRVFLSLNFVSKCCLIYWSMKFLGSRFLFSNYLVLLSPKWKIVTSYYWQQMQSALTNPILYEKVRNVVAIATVQAHSINSKLRFCAGSHTATNVSEVWDG